MTEFILISTHATVLGLNGAGAYDHVYHADLSCPLVFGEDGRPLRVSADVPEILGSAVALPMKGLFAFRAGETFLSASPFGGFHFSTTMEPWGTYTLLPLAALDVGGPFTVPSLIGKPRRRAIPKVIHQTCPPEMLPEFQRASEGLISKNPDWTYVSYSDKDQHDFIYEFFGWDVLRYYLRINPRYGAARADFFRYLCLYQRGGVYLDIKSSSSGSLDDIIGPDDQFLLCQWDNGAKGSYQGWGFWPELRHVPGGEYQQWHIISAPGHPFLEAVVMAMLRRIAAYDARLDGTGRVGTLRTTGPILYTRTIYPLLTPDNHRFLDAAHSGLDYTVVDGHFDRFASHYALQTTPVVS